MLKNKKIQISDLRIKTRKVASLHYLYALCLAVQLIAFDAGKLITPEVTLKRWISISLLLVVTTIVWYISKDSLGQPSTIKKLLLTLIIADTAMASFLIYLTRGFASKAVALYFIPIIISAVLARRSALMSSALLCVAAYVSTCVAYFVFNFNEGYKLELYGEIGFYSAMLIVGSMLIWVFVRPSRQTSK